MGSAVMQGRLAQHTPHPPPHLAPRVHLAGALRFERMIRMESQARKGGASALEAVCGPLPPSLSPTPMRALPPPAYPQGPHLCDDRDGQDDVVRVDLAHSHTAET